MRHKQTKPADKRWKAFEEKLINPDNYVECPVCGKELVYSKWDTVQVVKCKTPGCFCGKAKGL